jgi:hypothetical protein
MKEIKRNYLYLKNINYGKEILKSIHHSKVKFFAAQGNALDAAERTDFSEAKRYTIILCLIYSSTVKTCDNLITMFVKRIGKIQFIANLKNMLREKSRLIDINYPKNSEIVIFLQKNKKNYIHLVQRKDMDTTLIHLNKECQFHYEDF